MIYFLNFVLVLSCFFPLKSFGDIENRESLLNAFNRAAQNLEKRELERRVLNIGPKEDSDSDSFLRKTQIIYILRKAIKKGNEEQIKFYISTNEDIARSLGISVNNEGVIEISEPERDDMYPEYIEQYFLSGEVKIRLGVYEDAERDFTRALAISNALKIFERKDILEERIRRMKRLRALIEQGVDKEAVKFMAFFSDPEVVPEQYFSSGEVKIRTGDYEGAERDFTQALAISNALKIFERKDILEERIRLVKRLRALIERGVDKETVELMAFIPDPEVPDQYFLSGEVKIRLGDYEGAERDFTKAGDMGFRHKDLEERISFVRNLRTLQEQGDGEENVRLMADPELYFLIGKAKIKVGEYEHAEEYFTKAIEKQPDYKYYEARARVRYRLERYEEALKDMTTVLNSSPETEKRSDMYYFRGNMLLHIYIKNDNKKRFDAMSSEDISDRIRIAHNLRDGDLSMESKETKKSDRPDHTYQDYLDATEFLLDLAVKDFKEVLDLDFKEAKAAESEGRYGSAPKYVHQANENVPLLEMALEHLRSERLQLERLQSEKLQSERCRSAVSPSTS